MKSFGGVFLKSSSSSPQNFSSFGLDLIPQSSRFTKVAGWKNRFWARADFFLSPVKPTLVIWCVGSTGESVFRTLGFSAFRLVALVHSLSCASVQPVIPSQCLSACHFPVAPAYRSCSSSVHPVLSWVRFAASLDNCTGVLDLLTSV